MKTRPIRKKAARLNPAALKQFPVIAYPFSASAPLTISTISRVMEA